MTTIPLAVFWVMLLVGRKELGWKGALAFVVIWVALACTVQALGLNRYYFVATESLLDVVLVSTIYLGFARLR